MPVVYIIFYSLYGHVYTLSESVKQGLESQGITVKVFQVPETLSEDILEKMHAPPKRDIPVITVEELSKADGFLFGIPTRFGTMPAQIKAFLDSTGQLWATGALAGKFVGTFFSTAAQSGGQETTAFTTITYFAHHGMNYVPLGFANANMFDTTEVIGGSPYGSGTVANGDGSRQVSQKEKDIASTQGENFGKIIQTFHKGSKILNGEASEPADKVQTIATETLSVEPPVVTEEKPKPAQESSRSVAIPADSDSPKKSSKCFCM
ncbi:benzoquinone reductase [Phycomyces blakesleeanus NRRL 1555(-)]|uniref:Benzoquinone reductase n=2 Tax=Phycomyces blakesleeanus TaxID=4837 RepID=A0A167MGZ5_PHYB8|nr:benzoquinone reductase [Phycomyces blakesleeanus NRRL 1555(-)]OAD72814.1 benzoquinone reductase [Phycomyces blakesleeanus NRRL 1555(-)]|eukprot:XP_018290854.1 benzoquinone reductase [Phycomyces blakesleeanus NRRL 1555(-)]